MKAAQALSPREIVSELDRFVIGQDEAKRAVAIALRNRWRRSRVPLELREEITPFNIILIGSTGVGKTEIARRLAALAEAPFVKVEASRFTEVGYVGRDVDSMIRDLVDLAVQRERDRQLELLREQTRQQARDTLFELLHQQHELTRTKELEGRLDAGELKDLELTLQVEEHAAPQASLQVFGAGGFEEMTANLQEMMGDLLQPQLKPRQMLLPQALDYLEEQAATRELDMDQLSRKAIFDCEESGIVFIDEIDKICAPAESAGPDVSRQGVQKDILPVIEGTVVQTRYGAVRTHHMLFLASGAFHLSRPSDLIPELQGRFPVRVELDSLDEKALLSILTRPENALLKQYQALFAAEGTELVMKAAACREVARFAFEANRRAENIGARRLQSLMHLLLEEELFRMPDKGLKKLEPTAAMVRKRLAEAIEDVDLSRYIL